MSLKSKTTSSTFNPRKMVEALDEYKKDNNTLDESILNVQNIRRLLDSLHLIRKESTRTSSAMLIMSFLFSRFYIKIMKNPNYLKELSEKKARLDAMKPNERYSMTKSVNKLADDVEKLLQLQGEIDEIHDVLYSKKLHKYLPIETILKGGEKKHLRKKTYKTKTLKYKNGFNNSYRNRKTRSRIRASIRTSPF